MKSKKIIIGKHHSGFNSNKLNNNKNSLCIQPFKTTKKILLKFRKHIFFNNKHFSIINYINITG